MHIYLRFQLRYDKKDKTYRMVTRRALEKGDEATLQYSCDATCGGRRYDGRMRPCGEPVWE